VCTVDGIGTGATGCCVHDAGVLPRAAGRLERPRPDHRLARGIGGVEVDRRHDRPVVVGFGIVDDLSHRPGATLGVPW
jgi:hypothetical protein